MTLIINLQISNKKNGMSFMIKMLQIMVKEIKVMQGLNLIQKLSNHVSAIIQIHILLLQEI